MSTAGADAGRFAALWRRLGAATDPAPLYEALRAAYAQPHRHYHTFEHIARCLAGFDEARALARNPDAVELALWFHDAVYDPRAGDNEERSAAWALEALRAGGVDAVVGEHVRALILATRHAAAPSDEDESLVADVDLAILGAEPPEFEAYERAVREEYAWVPEPAFRAGRAAILRGLLARDEIYATPTFRDRYESRARANLTRSLARLA